MEGSVYGLTEAIHERAGWLWDRVGIYPHDGNNIVAL